MRKSKLYVVRSDNTITIKKKPDASHCVIFALTFLAEILLPVIFEKFRDVPLFWVVYAFCMVTNIVNFISVFFGKVVVDADKRAIYVCNLRRETFRFDELKELQNFFEAGDAEGGMDTHKVVFVFKSGHKSELQTTSKEQTQELIKVLSEIIWSRE